MQEKVNLAAKSEAFITLGKFLRQFSSVSFYENHETAGLNKVFRKAFEKAILKASIHNPWFTEEFIRYSLFAISGSLTEDKIEKWLNKYPKADFEGGEPVRTGVVMAGNIPLAGFHDLISTILSGNIFYGKMSSKDNILIPLIRNILCHINPVFEDILFLTDHSLKNIEAVIATGSNNSSRYFEYYFNKYPHIIRKNRNSAAFISGEETDTEFKKLADDVFLYFGMGCRNVSKIFIPEGFDPVILLGNFEDYSYLYHHNKYCNNYQYHKAIYLVNKVHHLDTGFLLFTEHTDYSSPVGVLYYETYRSVEDVKKKLIRDNELIQCIVSSGGKLPESVSFGKSQHPELWDYADHVDTLKFLLNLYKKRDGL